MDKSAKYIVQSKGEYQPSNGDAASWDFYWHKNAGKLAAAKLALKMFGEDVVARAQGTEWLNLNKPRLILAMMFKKRAGMDEELLVSNRGALFVRNLKRFLKQSGQEIETAAVAA
jgi:hypothetical protein